MSRRSAPCCRWTGCLAGRRSLRRRDLGRRGGGRAEVRRPAGRLRPAGNQERRGQQGPGRGRHALEGRQYRHDRRRQAAAGAATGVPAGQARLRQLHLQDQQAGVRHGGLQRSGRVPLRGRSGRQDPGRLGQRGPALQRGPGGGTPGHSLRGRQGEPDHRGDRVRAGHLHRDRQSRPARAAVLRPTPPRGRTRPT